MYCVLVMPTDKIITYRSASNVSSLSKLQQLTAEIAQPCNTPPAASINLTPSPNHHPHNTMTPPPPSHLVNQNRNLSTPPSAAQLASIPPYHKYHSQVSEQKQKTFMNGFVTKSSLSSVAYNASREHSTAYSDCTEYEPHGAQHTVGTGAAHGRRVANEPCEPECDAQLELNFAVWYVEWLSNVGTTAQLLFPWIHEQPQPIANHQYDHEHAVTVSTGSGCSATSGGRSTKLHVHHVSVHDK